MSLLTMNHITVAYDRVPVLNDLSLKIEKGDFLAVIGANGSGKSTLMRTMLGLIRPQKGDMKVSVARIGYLPQQMDAQRSFPASAEEVVISGCLHLPRRKRRAAVREKLALLDSEALAERPYRTLSGGQQQRVLLARALCAADGMLLLDEPVTGLDPETTQEMYRLLQTLNREKGVTIVMVTHDMEGAARYANKVLILSHEGTKYGSVDLLKGGNDKNVFPA